ncbi:MAG TPA: thiamine-phosphate kinase [candidate division Zixibacteria bacterium]|nr:thiamine-phosphate kinase [candidate division Zixibacteria bacterium]
MKIKDIGEFGFIDRIKSGCLIREKDVIKAIGDDCCVFRNSGRLVSLLTTDMLVENVHFLRDTIPPFKLGRKAMAVNFSDIAAMGGTPKEAVISIAIPDTIDMEYLDSLYDGMRAIAREFDVNILGGNTTSEPEHLVINIALIGEETEDQVLYRSGAKVGDIIFLTGQVGSSAAGLDILLHKRPIDTFTALIDAHLDPHPQIAEGRIIAGSKLAHSLIDISDGVASDLGHICDESKVGAFINEDKIPVNDIFLKYLEKYNLDFERLALHVGEDYILLGTAPESSQEALGKALKAKGCQFFVIGKISSEPGIKLIGRNGQTRQIRISGFDHFRREEQ